MKTVTAKVVNRVYSGIYLNQWRNTGAKNNWLDWRNKDLSTFTCNNFLLSIIDIDMGEDKAKYVHLFLFPSYRVCTILRRKTYFHQNVLAIWKNLKELERKSFVYQTF